MQTTMPFTLDDEEVFINTLILLENTRNQPNEGYSTPKEITRVFPLLAIVYPVHVMTRNPNPHFLVYHIYTTEDPKQVGRTLG